MNAHPVLFSSDNKIKPDKAQRFFTTEVSQTYIDIPGSRGCDRIIIDFNRAIHQIGLIAHFVLR